MSEERRKEKDEEKKREKDEKEEEKRKGWGEKWQRDRLNAMVWASVLVWAALVILAEATGFADDSFGDWWEAWAMFFAGFGAIVLLGTFYRMMVPEHRRPIAGGLIFGFILLGVGMGELLDSWNYVWVVVLIAIALIILFNAFIRPQRKG
jgi:peptidoglycan/LPS O-acetylase OafA/YrhL